MRVKHSTYPNHFSLDFSTFDKLIPFWLIDDIHQVFYSCYEIGPYYVDDPRYPHPSTTPEKVNNVWRFMNYSVKHGVYRTPDGARYIRRHSGLPSGLLQTQLLGSACNFVMIATTLFELGFNENDFKIKVLGDDSLVSFMGNFELPLLLMKFKELCNSIFNAKINIEKSIYYTGSSILQFLSYKVENGAVKRVNDDLLGKLLDPEKGYFTEATTKSRAIGILMANLGYDEIIHQICSDIIQDLETWEVTSRGLNAYDRVLLEYYINNFKKVPSRADLFRIALTPQPKIKDDNFLKFID